MNRKQHKLIYEFSGSRNLNTSPLDVTGLDGDKWDYSIEVICGNTTVNGSILVYPNNDQTSNYRYYRMSGQASSAGALVLDSDNRGFWLRYILDSNREGVARMFITGETGNERYCDVLYSGENTSSTVISKNSSYWKNNVDNLTSLTFDSTSSSTTDLIIRIYQVQKQANLDNYDLVDVKNFSAFTGVQTFNNLDGDRDEEYLIELEHDGSSSRPLVQINSITTGYTNQYLRNSSGTIGSTNQASAGFELLANTETGWRTSTFKLNAVSGKKRLGTSSASRTLGGRQQNENAGWCSNTVDNVTALTITNLVSATGTVKLYKRKSNRSIDPVPMRTVVEHDINGVDFSNGITISGIQGDRIDGAIKIEFVGETVSTGSQYVLAQLNGDTTGTNYPKQRLIGNGASVQALSYTSIGMIPITSVLNNSGTSKSSTFIYPISGQNRPILSDMRTSGGELTNTEQVGFYASWWNNSVDEITSMKIYSSNTNAITGKIRVSVVKGTRQASSSFTVVVN